MMTKIITDSTAYIPERLKKEYDIEVISLSVAFEDQVFKENNISNDTFYKKLDASHTIPTSSQPSIDEFYKIFEEKVKADHPVVGVFISSEMSGTYTTANLVKKMILENYPNAKIEIIDSRSNCMQLGYAAIAGAKLAKDGKSIGEVVEAVKENIKRSRFIFIPDTLKYLKKGGRIGSAKALLGSMLQIKPILTVMDGKTHMLRKVRTKKKALKEMIDLFLEDIRDHGLGEVMVHHIHCEEEAIKFANSLSEKVGESIGIASIGPVIGTHVGPGSLGIVYYTQKELREVMFE
ncbi:DegV family protein [Crassaminicella profunda]|uniref:DegV family protein n=1 Tax=Crassaminicella profunda TaxID=1286698 RepID=UPI001CA781A4|nr:DegV family protein [Crassaminicella profunda]QZY55901.1 DegV family protein [Crassaminicella profunda]